MTSLAQTIRGLWSAVTGLHTTPGPIGPKVIVHDPDAQRPHDLDDPFFDPVVQSRIAGVIAESTARKN